MDGFGLGEPRPDNAIAAANKPTYDTLIESCPFTKLDGSGLAVGLPDGQMGNSEVGHLNLGAGRVIYQDITRIDKSIADGDFFDNPVIVSAIDKSVKAEKSVHLIGLVSDGQVHSSLNHLFALVELAKGKGVEQLYLHALMDGRDTLPHAGERYMSKVLQKFKEFGLGKVATVGGRYYGMDRDKRWERTSRQYRASVFGEGTKVADPVAGIKASYKAGVTDEFIIPFVVDHGSEIDTRIKDGDTVIFFNFRSDRGRQLSKMFLGYDIPGFDYQKIPHIDLVTMTNYDEAMTAARVAFPPQAHSHLLGEVLSSAGLKQLRAAETEKYPHVTFFFNGGVERPNTGEDRVLAPSPKVATYDLKPEMSSVELTDAVIEKIHSSDYDFILINYANADMVGHTGVFEATKLAVEAVDRGLSRLLEAVKAKRGVAIITADHGNAEMMIDPETQTPWTAHTTSLVPCIFYDPFNQVRGRNNGTVKLRDGGILADIAPTVLDILGISKPEEMTGLTLIL